MYVYILDDAPPQILPLVLIERQSIEMPLSRSYFDIFCLLNVSVYSLPPCVFWLSPNHLVLVSRP